MRVQNPTCLAMCIASCIAITAGFSMAQQTPNRSRSLKFVPRDATAVVSIQVKSLMSSKLLSASAKEIGEQSLPMVPIELSKVNEVTFVILQDGAFSKLNLTPEGKQMLWKRISAMSKETDLNGFKFHKNREGVFQQLEDGQVLVASSEGVLLRALKTESADTTNWAEQWYASKSPVLAIANTSLLRGSGMLSQLMNNRPQFGRDGFIFPPSDVFAMANRSDRVWMEFQPEPTIALSIRGQCPTAEEAISFESGVRTSLSYGRNLISVGRQGLLDPNRRGTPLDALPLLNLLDRLLEFATVQRKELQVAANTKVSEADAEKLPGMISAALKALNVGRSNIQTQNNLKQIGLAMHNYESSYKKLPAAVQEGPNNVPRSWRVTLLPFLEQNELYNRYKQDEPWDSPSNLKLLDEIPFVYQGSKGGTNAAYFVFNGRNSIFDGNRASKFGEITDGLRNTLLAMEVELDIPWTKPQDIPFDMNQELPPFLKKGFNAVLADGSCHFIPPNTEENELKMAISKNDGQILKLFKR